MIYLFMFWEFNRCLPTKIGRIILVFLDLMNAKNLFLCEYGELCDACERRTIKVDVTFLLFLNKTLEIY